jgi:hypothetical protein
MAVIACDKREVFAQGSDSDKAIHPPPSFRGDAKHRTRNLEFPDVQLHI